MRVLGARPRVHSGAPSRAFDWLVIGASLWMTGGAYLDAWAHRHVLAFDTFFTPYHAILYSGLLAATLIVVGRLAWAGLPDGYGLSLAGCLLFGLGGLLDLAWHSLFGIERRFASLLSPTHLLLMLSAGLIATGPLRAAWRAGGEAASWPAVLAGAMLLAGLSFFGQFDHPLITPWAASPRPVGADADIYEVVGVFGVLMQTAFASAVLLLLASRWRLPLGAVTLVLALSGVLVTVIGQTNPVLLVVVGAGLLADIAYQLLRPSVGRSRQLRLFAALMPVLVWIPYFSWIAVRHGIWWPAHVVAGSVVAAALSGFLISYLVVPPRGSPAPC